MTRIPGDESTGAGGGPGIRRASTAPTTSAAKEHVTGSEAVVPASAPAAGVRVDMVGTDAGQARVSWHHASDPFLVLALGHGAGGGTEARELRALAEALPAHRVTVALVEQPWRVAGRKLAPAPRTLDTGWRGCWPVLTGRGLPVIAGGRSAGARVACRTARELGAYAVLALAFPLHPPGRPERSRAAELLGAGVPTLVVQGGGDPFGKPGEFPEGEHDMLPVPAADHGFAVPARADITQAEALRLITDGVVAWTESLSGRHRRSPLG